MANAAKGMTNPDVKGKMPTSTPSIKSAPKDNSTFDVGHSARLPTGEHFTAMQDHHTLMEAEHIKADPVKMHKVRQVSGRKMKAATAIHSVADIKAAGKKLRAGGVPGALGKAAVSPNNPDDGVGGFPAGERDHEAEDHYNTLHKAEEIKMHRGRMAGVRKVAQARLHAAHKVHEHAMTTAASSPSDEDPDEVTPKTYVGTKA